MNDDVSRSSTGPMNKCEVCTIRQNERNQMQVQMNYCVKCLKNLCLACMTRICRDNQDKVHEAYDGEND